MKSRTKREWSVYLVRCADGSLYTGVAKDVGARVKKHNDGVGAAYTRSHRPVRLVHTEEGYTRSQSLIREAQIKRYTRPKKEALIRPAKSPLGSLTRKIPLTGHVRQQGTNFFVRDSVDGRPGPTGESRLISITEMKPSFTRMSLGI